MIYFISGHRDFTEEEFNLHYVPKLKNAITNTESTFVVGDYWGVDEMAQDWLSQNLPESEHHRVTVYHMFRKPRVWCSRGFKLSGGYMSDIERDTAMTMNSNLDIAFIHKGRWNSGTAQNLLRRIEVGDEVESTPKYKDLLDNTKKIYKENDLCMSEILASTSANGLSIEEAFELYVELRDWSDGDKFYIKYGTEEDIELIKNNKEGI